MATIVRSAPAVQAKARILIVGDELVVRDSLGKWFAREGYAAQLVGGARAALETIEHEEFDLALIDTNLLGMDATELQARLQQADPELAVVVMSGFASRETVAQALSLVAGTLERQRARREVRRLREELRMAGAEAELIGESPAIRRVREMIEMVASTEPAVLITGENGTGKEVVARAIHASGPRRDLPLVPVRCGALTETQIESELFGYEKGVFPGALYRKKGKFEVADGGTVFLDEIGGVSSKMQAGLLRVLQDREIVRLGGNQPIQVHFRCVAATSQNLDALVKAGTFRPNLYHRLHVSDIHLPPLRDRRQDIPLLISHFLHRFCLATSRSVPQLSAEAMDLLVRHDWPGNVRELENAVERALLVGRGALEIQASDFSLQFGVQAPSAGRTLDDVERAHIERTLRETQHNMSRAARILNIDRTTLYNKLRRYGAG